MQNIQFKISGLKKLQDKLGNMSKKLVLAVDGEISDTVTEINREQVNLAPINDGQLRQHIAFNRNKEMDWSIFSNMPYSAYVEFGTGKLVDVPAGLEDYAIQFKGKGINQVNLPARPFFFTPYLTKKDDLIKNIRTAIKNIK